MASRNHSPTYWVGNTDGVTGEIPFQTPFVFRDSQTGVMMLYYWMCQLLFHRCIESVHAAISQPVIDAYPDMWLGLPSTLQIDIGLYQDAHELASNICRSLDAVLTTTVQPDMLIAPMIVVADYYGEINALSQDGMLEIMWLESFKNRLSSKGQHVANVVQEQRWTEVATFNVL